MSKGSDTALSLMGTYVVADRGGDIVDNFNGKNPDGSKCSSHYDSGLKDGMIVLDEAKAYVDGRNIGEVYVHESGHLIDNALGREKTGDYGSYLSDDEEFNKALDADYKDNIKRVKTEQNLAKSSDAQYYLAKEITVARGEETRQMCGVQDVFCGCSKGKVRGTYGHPAEYFKKGRAKSCEAFANMYECQFDKGKEAKMKQYFPKAYKRFCELLEENK